MMAVSCAILAVSALPALAADPSITVTAEDEASTSQSVRIADNIIDGTDAPFQDVLFTLEDEDGYLDEYFEDADDTSYDWTITTNGTDGLPEGLEVADSDDSSLTITGTPTKAGKYAITAVLTRSGEGEDFSGAPLTYSADYTVNVTALKVTLSEDASDCAVAYTGYPYRAVIVAEGASGDVKWTVASADETGDMNGANKGGSWSWAKITEDGATLIIEGVLPDSEDSIYFGISAADDFAEMGIEAAEDYDNSFTSITMIAYDDKTEGVEKTNVLAVNISAPDAEHVTLDQLPKSYDVTDGAGAITADYSATIKFPDGAFVSKDDMPVESRIHMPRWLVYTLTKDAAGAVKEMKITFNASMSGDIAAGDSSAVRIDVADDNTYEGDVDTVAAIGWPVVYMPEAFSVTASKTSMSIRSGASDTVTLSSSNNYGGVSYTLEVSGDTPASSEEDEEETPWATVSGNTAIFSPDKEGDFEVILTARDSLYRKENITFNVKVLEPFTVSMDIGHVVADVNGTKTIAIDVTGATGAVTYDLTVSEDSEAEWAQIEGDSIVLTPDKTGTFTLNLTITDGNERTVTRVFTVKVLTPFTLSADTTALSMDAGDTRSVALSSAGAEGTVRYTTNLDWATVSEDTLILTPAASGDFTVTVTGTDGEARTQSLSVSVKVLPVFVLSADATAITAELNQETTFKYFTEGAVGSVDYSVELSGDSSALTFTSGDCEITFTPSAMSDFVFIITASDNASRSRTLSVDVKVIHTFTITASPDAVTMMAGDTETVTLSADNAVGLVRYSAPDGINWITISGDTATLAPTGEYNGRVTFTAKDSLDVTSSVDVSVTVSVFKVTADRSTVSLAAGSTATITMSSNGQGVTYTTSHSWATVNGSTITLAPTEAGSYTLTITGTDSKQRTDTASVAVTVTSGTSTDSDDQPGAVAPQSLQPERSTMDVSDEDVEANVKETIGNVPENATLEHLPSGAAGTARTVTEVINELSGDVLADEEVIAVLGVISVDKPAVYVFMVDLSGIANLKPGAPLILHMLRATIRSGSAEVSAAAEEDTNCTLVDDEGNEVTTVPENKRVNIAAYMETGKTYEPILTTASSSSYSNNDPGSPGGGCDAGFGALALAAASLFICKKRS